MLSPHLLVTRHMAEKWARGSKVVPVPLGNERCLRLRLLICTTGNTTVSASAGGWSDMRPLT